MCRLVCYTYGQSSHFQRECPSTKWNLGGARSQDNSLAPPPPPRGTTLAIGGGLNRLYSLSNCQEVEATPNIVTGTLQIFSRDVYVFLDPGSTLSYVTPYVFVSFRFEPEVILKPLLVILLWL